MPQIHSKITTPWMGDSTLLSTFSYRNLLQGPGSGRGSSLQGGKEELGSSTEPIQMWNSILQSQKTLSFYISLWLWLSNELLVLIQLPKQPSNILTRDFDSFHKNKDHELALYLCCRDSLDQKFTQGYVPWYCLLCTCSGQNREISELADPAVVTSN